MSLEEEICHNIEKPQVDDKMTLNGKISDISLSTKCIDHENYGDLKLPNKSNEDIILNNDHSAEFRELLTNQCLSSKKFCPESTQTDDCNNTLSSLFSSKTPPPPMNFVSILKCKYRLQEKENDNLEFSKPIADLSIKGSTQSNNLNYTININKPIETKIQKVLDNTIHLSSLNYDEQKHCLSDYESSLKDILTRSDQNGLFFNHVTNENICKKNLQIQNNDKLLSKLNITTNEDGQQVLKKCNNDFDFSTKNNCFDNENLHNVSKPKEFKKYENNSINKTWPYVSKIDK